MRKSLSIIFIVGILLALYGCIAEIRPEGYYYNRPYYYGYPSYRYYYYDYGYPEGRYYYFRHKHRGHR
jgi:hypothetical protein